jgi:hypothetical protein
VHCMFSTSTYCKDLCHQSQSSFALPVPTHSFGCAGWAHILGQHHLRSGRLPHLQEHATQHRQPVGLHVAEPRAVQLGRRFDNCNSQLLARMATCCWQTCYSLVSRLMGMSGSCTRLLWKELLRVTSEACAETDFLPDRAQQLSAVQAQALNSTTPENLPNTRPLPSNTLPLHSRTLSQSCKATWRTAPDPKRAAARCCALHYKALLLHVFQHLCSPGCTERLQAHCCLGCRCLGQGYRCLGQGWQAGGVSGITPALP